MSTILENLPVQDCFSTDAHPRKGSKFDLWINEIGGDVKTHTAGMLWVEITRVTSLFTDDSLDIEQRINSATKDLSECVDVAWRMAHLASEEPFNPFELDAYLMDFIAARYMGIEPEYRFTEAQIMGAFALICVDKMVTCLIQNDAHMAVELALAFNTSLTIVDDHQEPERSQVARKGGIARAERSPKTLEKSFVRDCWNAWREKPTLYKGKADFARDMLSKCEHLTSQKKIEDWCREWERETEA